MGGSSLESGKRKHCFFTRGSLVLKEWRKMKTDIIYKKTRDLIEYKNNPRKNDNAVDYVAKSIKEFGFKVPIIVDKNNVVVAGHTRLKACKKLGIEEAPVIVADDLTEEQIKAFRLIENKTSENAKWDNEKLHDELLELPNFDFKGFDLEIPEIKLDIEENTEFHREMTGKQYNLQFYNELESTGKWQMPIIRKTDYIPKDLIGFNYMLSNENKNVGIHCFVDDYQFERVWREPMKYYNKIMEYDCFLSPDFSLYMDMPMAMKIWNVYRSRLIGQLYQSLLIQVIPTISWAEKETFDFCFDGIEPGGVVAVSTIGVKQSKEAFKVWKDGMDEMIKRLKPTTILCYGGEVEYDYQGINVIYYENKVTEKFKEK